jgi:RND family efflux transporter MFP subunit
VLPPVVSVIKVDSASTDGQSFTGVIRARVESDLGFRIAGKVTQRLVDRGQSVRQGQPLMRLDPSDLALSAAASNANVAAAKAKSVQADADLARLKGLVSRGAISAQSYDEAEAASRAARAQWDAAVAQAQVASHAETYAVLLADADGIVEDTLAEPGQVVAAGQTVVKLAHAGPREAAADLPETIRPALGSAATATLYGSGATFAATLRQLSHSADPVTRTYEARYVLQGAGAAAPLGATATVRLPAPSGRGGATRVPLGALYDPGGGPGVWIVAGDKASFRTVRLRALATEEAVIEGLTPGTTIVALGADRLREGQAIRPRPLVGAPS